MRLRREQKAQQVGWGEVRGVDEQKPVGENKVLRPGGWRESDQSGVGDTVRDQNRTQTQIRGATSILSTQCFTQAKFPSSLVSLPFPEGPSFYQWGWEMAGHCGNTFFSENTREFL